LPAKRKQLTVSLVALGCPKNLVDSERMLADLAAAGCVVAAPTDDADVVVINTCGFLAAARDEALEAIAEAVEHKRAGRVRRVVVAGCLPSRDGERLFERADGIDALVGVNNRDDLLAAVLETGRSSRIDACPRGGRTCPDDRGRFRLTPRHTAYLRIAEGCSQRCTYCTVPAIRGAFRSKPPEGVLAEARELVADGAVELNVIAQNTAAYGTDLRDGEGGRPSLASLLRRLDEVDGLEWIRLLYTYPRRFTDELIDVLAGAGRLVPYVDIPLQHVADGVLKRMGRGVSRAGVESLLDKLRRRVEGLVLRTTFIVGFPGETEQEFAELLRFVEDFRFDALGVFEFSPEEGTPAARMPDQVLDAVKARRAGRIMLAQQHIAFENSASAVGRPVVVLVDGRDESGRGVGRHRGQAPEIDSRCILTEPRPAGHFVQGEVVAAAGYDLVVKPGEPAGNRRSTIDAG